MKQEEVIERLKEELNLPFFNGTLEEKNYSEADYQQIKKELIQYFDDNLLQNSSFLLAYH